MRLIAHRGFASRYPENTVRGAEIAAEVADEVEIDVRRCGSGELVVIHDETVDRVTDGSGAVAEYARSDLEALDVLGTGEGVPTLSEVLRALPDRVDVNVELKEPRTATDALEAIESLHSNAIVSSFSPEILADCRVVDRTIQRAYITDKPGNTGIEIAADLGCAYLHPSKEVCTERLIEAAHREGMGVNAWTVDTPAEAAALADAGVDGVIADRPSVLSKSTL